MTAAQPTDEWNALPWRDFERQVFKLQTRIYRASQRDDIRTVHRLQRLLLRSRAARVLAVRRVTQDNRGKKTAGVDGVKSLTPPQRLRLAANLRLSGQAQPLRRVWIPKPGTEEQRPLGIPTLGDRARQALAKLALEPEWEAKFEPNSYGFRPGRSCHDAIEAVFGGVRLKPKYVLDADIARCFDRIAHQALLTKLHTYPTMRRTIRAWLRAGVLEGTELFPTTEGTPQGGVTSPLLANIALHGLEAHLRAAFPTSSQGKHVGKPVVVRYADDFVVLHAELAVIERVQELANAWLADMGLELKPSKTRITHTLHPLDGQRGFDFLGFWVRQHRVGKTHSGRLPQGPQPSVLLGFKTIISPSHAAQRRHSRALSEVLRHHKMAPQGALIARLNPVIRGWSRYYSSVSSKDTLGRMDNLTYLKLCRWARFRHPHKSRRWVARKYWHPERGPWTFAAKGGARLLKHASTPIRRHTKVRGEKSPFDGDWVYWTSRVGKHPELSRRVARLLQRQQGQCAHCGLLFRQEDVLEVDHLIPRALGGRDVETNRQLLHGHCHDQKTATDGSLAGGTHDKG